MFHKVTKIKIYCQLKYVIRTRVPCVATVNNSFPHDYAAGAARPQSAP